MVRWYLAAVLAALPHLLPAPPGIPVQQQTVYLSGDGMSSRWTAVVSKKLAGRMMGKTPVYQWYLSIYSPPAGDVARLAFQSPGGSPLLATVQKARGAAMYFPFQDLKLIGAAQLERPDGDDLVVAFHESGADCGAASVAVLGADAQMHVHVRKQVTNYCSLDAAIVRDGALSAVRLTGPYYTARSPVCCPAKAKAGAVLRYRAGAWRVTPGIFPPGGSHLP